MFAQRARRSTATETGTDRVREQAQTNYNAVVQELNARFKNYKENCFPRPRGCLCTISMDKNGREVTERRMNDADCKN
jgi:hypothetical protein